MIRRLATAVLLLSLAAVHAQAQTGFESVASGFQPRVPVSLLGSLGSLGSMFDASRFHMSSTFTVGSGGYGSGTNALNVTSFSYQFRAPAALSVSVGNAFGPNSTTGSGMFLEGVNLSVKPTQNSMFRIQYQNVRSPLQYGYGYGPDRPFWGY
jgi:hypothetical protein